MARAVVDAALEVHKVLGPGFAESVYEEALAVELSRREMPFERQVPLTVKHKAFCVGEGRADLLVDSELIVELKAVEQLESPRSRMRSSARRVSLARNPIWVNA